MATVNGTNCTDCPLPISALPRSMFVAAEVLTALLAIFGFVGNLLTVFAIVTSNLKANINSILIGNLSFAQVIYCGLILPLQALVFHSHDWTLPMEVCTIHAAVRFWLIGVDMMLLSAIAFYRYLNICHQHLYSKLTARAPFSVVVVVCWVLSIFFCMTPVIGVWGSFSFEKAVLQCTFTHSSEKSHKITTITLGFVIPCLLICFCYLCIGYKAYTSRKRVTRTASQYRREKAQKDSLRLTGMMLCIFCGFLISTTPYFIVNILDPNFKVPLPHIWAPFMAWLLYCLNPVIYTVMDRNFQNAYRRLLLCRVWTTGGGQHLQSFKQESSYADR